MNIRNKVMLTVLIPLAVVFSSTSILFYLHSSSVVERQAAETLLTYAQGILNEYQEHIRHYESDVRKISRLRMVRDYLEIVEHGRAAENEAHLRTLEGELLKIIQSTLDCESVFMSGLDGKNTVEIIGGKFVLRPHDDSQAEWFSRALQAPPGETFVSTLQYCHDHNTPEIVLSTVLYDESGRAKGVIGAHFQTAAIFRHLLSRIFSAESNAYLVDKRGFIAIHQDPGHEGLNVGGLASTELVFAGKTGTVTELGEQDLGLYKKVYLPIPNSEYGLIVSQPLNEILALGRRFLLFNTVAVTAVALLLLLVISFLTARALVAPLKKLARAAAEIGRGDFDARVPITGADEIGETAGAINKMAEDLKTTTISRNELETAVRLRTADLISANEELEGEIVKRLKAESFNTQILASVQEGFIVVSPAYRIEFANKAFCCLVGLSAEQVVGRKCYDVVHKLTQPCGNEGEICVVGKTLESGESHSAVHVHRAEDKTRSYIEVTSYPIKGPDGLISGVIETFNDVTDQRKLEEQLRQSQKMEAIGQLAGEVAHDFNNYLTGIIGYAYLVRMKMSETDPLKMEIDQIFSAAEKAAQTTRALLAFSRKQVINPKPQDINEVVKKSAIFLDRFIGIKIAMKLELSEATLPVSVDSGGLEQVLLNIVSNARDAMPGGGTLTIETAAVDLGKQYRAGGEHCEAGKYALIAVSDDGVGIPDNILEKVFEPFFTTKGEAKGTGLGLAIAYGIVKQHRGYISAYSVVGKGTTFKIYLPLLEHSDMGIAAGHVVESLNGTETVLLAEDDRKIRSALADILEGFGYVVIEAQDGEDAVKKFSEHADQIGIVVLDVVMPKMNGKEAFEEIKRQKPGLHAVFISGYTANIIHKDGLLERGVTLVTKPIHPETLLKSMRDLLDGNKGNSGVVL